MAKRRNRPEYLTSETSTASLCDTCSIKHQCGLFDWVKQTAKRNKKEHTISEFGCTWHSDYADSEAR